MKLKELVAPSLKELFIQQIENMILSGDLKIGDKLPSERELSAQLKVSRVVINSGILEMANKGFLEIQPRKGVFVADYTRTGKLDTLISIMNYNGGKLDKRNFRSLTEVRMAIEIPSAKMAAQHRTEKDLQDLRDIINKLEKTQSVDDAAELYFKFHHTICVASGNTIFPLIFYSFKVPYTSLLRNFCKIYGVLFFSDDLDQLVTHIEHHESEEAAALIKKAIECKC